jgi:hypothetical protein
MMVITHTYIHTYTYIGLGNAWFFQARDYYFKDIANLDPAEAQANSAAAHTPWNSKLTAYCMLYIYI